MEFTQRDWECALMLACAFIHKHPCDDADAYFNNGMMDLLVGDAHDDQRSVEWAIRFFGNGKK